MPPPKVIECTGSPYQCKRIGTAQTGVVIFRQSVCLRGHGAEPEDQSQETSARRTTTPTRLRSFSEALPIGFRLGGRPLVLGMAWRGLAVQVLDGYDCRQSRLKHSEVVSGRPMCCGKAEKQELLWERGWLKGLGRTDSQRLPAHRPHQSILTL